MTTPSPVRVAHTDEDLMEDLALLTLDEAAELLSLGRSTLYKLMRAGEMRAIRVGRSIRIPRGEVKKLIARKLDEHEGER